MEQKRIPLNNTCSATDIKVTSRIKASVVSTNLKYMPHIKNDATGKCEQWHTLIWVLPV